MKTTRRILLVCVVALLTTGPAFAQNKDLNGSKDHPLLTRYPESIIDKYSIVVFDEFTLPLGKVKAGGFEKFQSLKGKITRIFYDLPKGPSILEVYRYYESALTSGGFQILYSCTNNEGCGTGRDPWLWSSGQHALSAKLDRPEGAVYVHLHIGQWFNGMKRQKLYVVETKPIKTGQVSAD
jgi:OOP family OmpA-OmpF porin